MRVYWKKGFRYFVMGTMALILMECLVVLSGVQHSVGRWLQVKNHPVMVDPDWIIILGGGGIPSESGLIRCFYGAEAWKETSSATCIVSLSADENPEESSVGLMKQELLIRGVPASHIDMEWKAVNTRQQAHFIADAYGDAFRTGQVMIVSSPFHLRRAVMCFEKAGCRNLGLRSASSIGTEAEMGPGIFFRYRLWSLLEDQVRIVRELVAIGWYSLKG